MLTSADAATIVAWRYPSEYSTYDVVDSSVLTRGHWALTEGDELIGYCCFGAPARVAGAERLYVLEWNECSRIVAAGHGFAVESALQGDEHRFLVMVRQARD